VEGETLGRNVAKWALKRYFGTAKSRKR
jgi:hypothetical protein